MNPCKPTHRHDCTKCRFVATTINKSTLVDWYVCGDEKDGSVIGRYSSDGPDYWSMPQAMLKEDGDYDAPAWWQAKGRHVWSTERIIAYWILRQARKGD